MGVFGELGSRDLRSTLEAPCPVAVPDSSAVGNRGIQPKYHNGKQFEFVSCVITPSTRLGTDNPKWRKG
jgi:hypothetical protein